MWVLFFLQKNAIFIFDIASNNNIKSISTTSKTIQSFKKATTTNQQKEGKKNNLLKEDHATKKKNCDPGTTTNHHQQQQAEKRSYLCGASKYNNKQSIKIKLKHTNEMVTVLD